ncbi:uncharacterized protein LOC105781679 isoform X2 [Gossypium raimondii]|uniref:uncharacterized protein LOC105781679 isoform X2 n=1 Tax=Gossypium raimondii TaxID=29730 RepID=UPI00227C8F72|nr:uncharacterized protein LOC105781679 isoform X2 [Gossypium raimondii]
MFFAGVSLFAALGFLLYGGRDDEDDSVAEMKAAKEALEAKQKLIVRNGTRLLRNHSQNCLRNLVLVVSRVFSHQNCTRCVP